MKKTIAFIICIVFLISGCSPENKKTDDNNTDYIEGSVPENVTASDTENGSGDSEESKDVTEIEKQQLQQLLNDLKRIINKIFTK